MELGTLFNFAILLFCGLIFAKIIRYFKLPDVTGYLIGGLIIGPSVLGLLSADAVAGLSLVSDVALGFIPVSIYQYSTLPHKKKGLRRVQAQKQRAASQICICGAPVF